MTTAWNRCTFSQIKLTISFRSRKCCCWVPKRNKERAQKKQLPSPMMGRMFRSCSRSRLVTSDCLFTFFYSGAGDLSGMLLSCSCFLRGAGACLSGKLLKLFLCLMCELFPLIFSVVRCTYGIDVSARQQLPLALSCYTRFFQSTRTSKCYFVLTELAGSTVLWVATLALPTSSLLGDRCMGRWVLWSVVFTLFAFIRQWNIRSYSFHLFPLYKRKW